MLESMQRKMAIDFADSETKLTKDQWNDKYFRAEAKVKYATTEQLIEDTEIKNELNIYLKGRFINPTLHKNLSKYKLIRKINNAKSELTISELKKMSKSKLINIEL
ncbi:MAG: hypothetical protein H8D97_01695 [Proteobacteria bacterium]|nr:hypothetical protein [Pseudomonadota bacterium]